MDRAEERLQAAEKIYRVHNIIGGFIINPSKEGADEIVQSLDELPEALRAYGAASGVDMGEEMASETGSRKVSAREAYGDVMVEMDLFLRNPTEQLQRRVTHSLLKLAIAVLQHPLRANSASRKDGESAV